MTEKQEKLEISPENAQKIWDWLNTRGGIAIWNSANLSNPGASWTTPLHDESGETPGKPNWQAGEIIRQISNHEEVVVVIAKEVKRFHVAVRRGSGFMLQCTESSSDKIKKAVSRASSGNKEAWYEFDYSTQEAVILVPEKIIPIKEFVQQSE